MDEPWMSPSSPAPGLRRAEAAASVTSYELHVTSYKLQVTGLRRAEAAASVTSYELPVARYKVRSQVVRLHLLRWSGGPPSGARGIDLGPARLISR